mmetsp:Transcript_103780/g.289004  ORF Transcript_103780/g.289004 Transcript_103780/m.289004 type:complete len:238 (-) Transcript_103780:1364-2077(-)
MGSSAPHPSAATPGHGCAGHSSGGSGGFSVRRASATRLRSQGRCANAARRSLSSSSSASWSMLRSRSAEAACPLGEDGFVPAAPRFPAKAAPARLRATMPRPSPPAAAPRPGCCVPGQPAMGARRDASAGGASRARASGTVASSQLSGGCGRRDASRDSSSAAALAAAKLVAAQPCSRSLRAFIAWCAANCLWTASCCSTLCAPRCTVKVTCRQSRANSSAILARLCQLFMPLTWTM